MNPIHIDLNDYIRTGEGANGASFNHKTDPTVMLKLYFHHPEGAARELELAKKVYQTGIPTPEPGDLVTDGERIGIRFRRLEGKKSYSRACGDHPEQTDELAREFAQLCKRLHTTHVDTTQFESVKTRLYGMLAANPYFTEYQKSKIHDFIAAAPETDTAIHGDLQFSNGIFVEKDGKREPYFIDLGDFCYGYPMFDVGMVYLCCCMDDEAWIKEMFHMTAATAERFWDAFAQEYFLTDDCPVACYGPGTDMEKVLHDVKIYAALKTLIIERDAQCEMPQFKTPLEGTIY